MTAAEVKQSVDIVRHIRGYVRLRKVGTRHVGLCPFHNEKTPSFSVSGQEQYFKCFGCNAGGDVFSFVMNIEQLRFPEAVRSLADQYSLGPVDSAQRDVITRRWSAYEDGLCCKWWWARRIAEMRDELDSWTAIRPAPILIDRHDDGTATVTALGPVPEEYAWADCVGRLIRHAESMTAQEQMAVFRQRATSIEKAEYQRIRTGLRAVTDAVAVSEVEA